MKIDIIIALGLSVSSCIPVPVTPVPDISDGSQNNVNDSGLVVDSQIVVDTSPNLVDTSAVNDVLVVDSFLDINLQTDTQEEDGAKSTCAKACSNLTKLGCSEGKDSNCISVCDHLSKTHLIKFDAKCLSVAKDVKAIKACGGVSCNK